MINLSPVLSRTWQPHIPKCKLRHPVEAVIKSASTDDLSNKDPNVSQRRIIFFVIFTVVIIGTSYILVGRDAVNLSASTSTSVSLGVDNISPTNITKTTDELITFWHNRFERDPRDYISLTYLGQAYINKARETGDAGFYTRAEAALQEALTLNPNYETGLAFLASVFFAQHNFQEALDLANRVYAFDPRALHALATSGDAHLELGHYAEAEIAYRTLNEKNPSPPVFSRLARLAWLQGQPDKALGSMQQAVTEAEALGLTGEQLAWYHFQLGELYFNTGQVAAAQKQYTLSLEQFPNYYLGLVGLGKAQAAQSDFEAAIEFYQRSTAIVPQPDFLAALGDLYHIVGQPNQAQQQYDTVEFIGKLAEVNQQIYNRQLANFYTDHDLHLAEALKLAAAELEIRQDIYGLDTAAWAYYKNGQLDKAQAMIEQALQLGTRDAKLYYHAGMIAQAQGDVAQAEHLLAEALTINPHFDLLQADIAQATLDQLRAIE